MRLRYQLIWSGEDIGFQPIALIRNQAFLLTVTSRSSPWHEKKSCRDVPLMQAKKCSLGV